MWLCRFQSVPFSYGSLKLSNLLPDGPSVSHTPRSCWPGSPSCLLQTGSGTRDTCQGLTEHPLSLSLSCPLRRQENPLKRQLCCLWQGWPGTHMDPRLFCSDPHAGLQLEALLHHSLPPSQSRHPLLPCLSRGLGTLLRTSRSYHTATVDDNRVTHFLPWWIFPPIMPTSPPPQASLTEGTDKANMCRLFSGPQTRSGGALFRKMVTPGDP